MVRDEVWTRLYNRIGYLGTIQVCWSVYYLNGVRSLVEGEGPPIGEDNYGGATRVNVLPDSPLCLNYTNSD